MSTKRAYNFIAGEEKYRRMDIASLHWSADDARQARDAMRGHDPSAEAWYADDLATILQEIRRRAYEKKRKNSGVPVLRNRR